MSHTLPLLELSISRQLLFVSVVIAVRFKETYRKHEFTLF